MAPELNIIKDPQIVFKRCMPISNSIGSSNFPPKWWSNNIIKTNNNNTPNSKKGNPQNKHIFSY